MYLFDGISYFFFNIDRFRMIGTAFAGCANVKGKHVAAGLYLILSPCWPAWLIWVTVP